MTVVSTGKLLCPKLSAQMINEKKNKLVLIDSGVSSSKVQKIAEIQNCSKTPSPKSAKSNLTGSLGSILRSAVSNSITAR